MTTVALKLSRHVNAVSSLNGRVSRQMWQCLWPNRATREVPIGHITNGAHLPTWLVPDLARVYGDCLGPDWRDHPCDVHRWRKIDQLDELKLWSAKASLKRRLLRRIAQKEEARARRLGLPNPSREFRLDALTIGFARRFAVYKRALLLFEDFDRAKRLLTDPEKPVQLIFAGKAHPADEPGKAILRRLVEISNDPALRDRVVVIEDYDKSVSREIISGSDLWLNSPRRPHEACGTSGIKAVFNATLNCSTLDGWWDEAFDTTNGFAFGDGLVHVDPSVQDARDAESLMKVLETEIVPMFYHRDDQGVPHEWIKRAKHALRTLAPRYNADRMVMDYVRWMYLPASRTSSAEIPPRGHLV